MVVIASWSGVTFLQMEWSQCFLLKWIELWILSQTNLLSAGGYLKTSFIIKFIVTKTMIFFSPNWWGWKQKNIQKRNFEFPLFQWVIQFNKHYDFRNTLGWRCIHTRFGEFYKVDWTNITMWRCNERIVNAKIEIKGFSINYALKGVTIHLALFSF